MRQQDEQEQDVGAGGPLVEQADRDHQGDAHGFPDVEEQPTPRVTDQPVDRRRHCRESDLKVPGNIPEVTRRMLIDKKKRLNVEGVERVLHDCRCLRDLEATGKALKGGSEFFDFFGRRFCHSRY